MLVTALASGSGFVACGHHGHVTGRVAPQFAANGEQCLDPPFPETGVFCRLQAQRTNREWVLRSDMQRKFPHPSQHCEAVGLDLYSELKLLGRNLKPPSSVDAGIPITGEAHIKVEGGTGHHSVWTGESRPRLTLIASLISVSVSFAVTVTTPVVPIIG
jgi:hypothetical protein